jgi:hypothetical protein
LTSIIYVVRISKKWRIEMEKNAYDLGFYNGLSDGMKKSTPCPYEKNTNQEFEWTHGYMDGIISKISKYESEDA